MAADTPRATRAGIALLLLCACPQLLDDGFELLAPREGSLPDATGAAGRGPAEPTDAGAGGTGGAWPDGGGTAGHDAGGGEDAASLEPDATGPEPDATGPEPDATGPAEPQDALRSALVHRYRFDPDAPLEDSAGTAEAISAEGVTFLDGAAVFAGTGQFIDLPNDLIAGLTDCTIETWVVWTPDDVNASSASWQRIFDFGSNSSLMEGEQGSNANAIYLSPKSGGPAGKLHLEYESNGNINIDAPERLPTNVLTHLAVVVDDSGDILCIYRDGLLQGALAFSGSLTTITYKNNWLGRSQYEGDPPFDGRLLEFRIYAAALGPELIQASQALGPDAEL